MEVRSEYRRISDGGPGNLSSVSPIYPSYKSFDQFIDVSRLRSLDDYVSERTKRHIIRDSGDNFINQHCLDVDAPQMPGVREVWLTRTVPGTTYDYLDINRTDRWEETAAAGEFALLMDFIYDLPFESRGRILLIYDEGGNSVPAHKDHEERNICHDFIWLRTNVRKPFYLLNQNSGEKMYVSGYSA